MATACGSMGWCWLGREGPFNLPKTGFDGHLISSHPRVITVI